MIYVIADIHGEYAKYKTMLDKIAFSSNDTLYVLGDVVDRGQHPIKLLRDMASRNNVYPLLGNHEAVALDVLKHLMVEITDENYATHMDTAALSHLLDWQEDGGATTLREFQKLSIEERYDLLDYMEDFALYDVVDVGINTFILCHAGFQNFSKSRDLESYLPHELILGRHNYERQYFNDSSIYIVTGHTSTLSITGYPSIYINMNNIAIDCGAAYPNGRLACLCLDTMEEFYV